MLGAVEYLDVFVTMRNHVF